MNQTLTPGSFCGKVERMRNVPQKKPCVEGLVAQIVRLFIFFFKFNSIKLPTPLVFTCFSYDSIYARIFSARY